MNQTANVNGRDNIIVQASGGANIVVGGQPYLKLTQYVRRTQLAARDNSETSRLSAYRSDVVGLIGRDGEMTSLRQWLAGPEPVSIRVIVGAGGRGKTRLALELARVVSDDWLAGFVADDEFDRFRAQARLEAWGWDQPVLVIIDYAATRAAALGKWVRELVNAPLDGRPPFRLLLLERQANPAIGWFATVFGLGHNDDSRAAKNLLDPPEPVELPALDDLAFRRSIFAATFGRPPPAPGADREFDRLLGDRKWAGDPLYLLMAGFVAAGGGAHAALSLSRADLAFWVAGRELDRIGKIGAARGVDVAQNRAGAFVRHMAAMATLTQGLTLAEARELARSELAALDSRVDLDLAIETLHDALPGASGAVAPILPDIVGEAAILAWLGDGGDLASRGLASPPRIAAAAKVSLQKVCATLVRAAQDFAAAGQIEPVRWLEGLANAPEIDLGALVQIANTFANESFALREIAAELAAKIAHRLWAADLGARDAHTRTTLMSLRATALNNFSIHLSELGRRKDALAPSRKAVKIWRRLASEGSEKIIPRLVESLNSLSIHLMRLGKLKDSLTAVSEAVEICRPLVIDPSGELSSYLAASLRNLSVVLRDLGRQEEALAAAEECLDIYRRLAEDRPEVFLPDLAGSLNNLSNISSDLDQRADAAEEAVNIYHRLADDRPDSFLPDLAMSLNTFSNCLSELGRREDALEAVEKAVEIYSRLAADRPDAFLPYLALSWNNLGNRLGDIGRRAEALTAVEKAVETFRRLAADKLAAVLPDFAMTLKNFGNRLSELGRPGDAIVATREAVSILAPIFLNLPQAHGKLMAVIFQQYIVLSKRVGVEPDGALLAPIAVALQRLRATEGNPKSDLREEPPWTPPASPKPR